VGRKTKRRGRGWLAGDLLRRCERSSCHRRRSQREVESFRCRPAVELTLPHDAAQPPPPVRGRTARTTTPLPCFLYCSIPATIPSPLCRPLPCYILCFAARHRLRWSSLVRQPSSSPAMVLAPMAAEAEATSNLARPHLSAPSYVCTDNGKSPSPPAKPRRRRQGSDFSIPVRVTGERRRGGRLLMAVVARTCVLTPVPEGGARRRGGGEVRRQALGRQASSRKGRLASTRVGRRGG
jgi:hypothetical protein